MIDEREYKRVYGEVNPRQCAFEKAVLRRTFGCRKLTRINIAEREAAGCSDAHAQARCEALLERLRDNAAFALRLPHIDGPLPHGKEIRVQCGGLLGVQRVTDGTSAEAGGVDDIFALIDRAVAAFEDLDALPYAEIVQSVAHYEPRKKGSSS